jgi:hypothetical protein
LWFLWFVRLILLYECIRDNDSFFLFYTIGEAKNKAEQDNLYRFKTGWIKTVMNGI